MSLSSETYLKPEPLPVVPSQVHLDKNPTSSVLVNAKEQPQKVLVVSLLKHILWELKITPLKEMKIFLNFSFARLHILLNAVARRLKRLRTPKGDYWIKQWFSSIVSLFKMGTSLKEKNLLPEEANSFLSEQFLKVWKITFTTLGELPWVLLFLLRACVYCVMGATPMLLKLQCYILLLQNQSTLVWKLENSGTSEHYVLLLCKCWNNYNI